MLRSTSSRLVMVEYAVEARGLVRMFTPDSGIRGVDVNVEYGSIHALVGLNGAGKSTLMRLLLGMLRPSVGTVAIGGRGLDHADWATVGHLVEYPFAYQELTTAQNLELGARLHGVRPMDVAAMRDRIMDELNLRQFANRRSGKLSLGNRQRLGLASAM